MTALRLKTRDRTPTTIDDDLVGVPGYSYVCRRCDVYGYLAAGERKQCWSCETGDDLDRR